MPRFAIVGALNLSTDRIITDVFPDLFSQFFEFRDDFEQLAGLVIRW